MNFARDLVDCAERGTVALVELAREGERHEWTFAEVGAAATKLAGYFTAQGLRRGDIVLIWLGNRSEWVLSMLACFRLGLVAASCPEQLRSKDLRLRIEAISPTLIVADERNRRELERVRPSCPVAWVPHPEPFESAPPARAAELDSTGPCLITFTSGTSGTPKPVLHLQRYLTGQWLQGEHWMGVQPGDVVWCTASSGWSKERAQRVRRAMAARRDGTHSRRAIRSPSGSSLNLVPEMTRRRRRRARTQGAQIAALVNIRLAQAASR